MRQGVLKAPIVVVAAGNEWELEQGRLSIGRDPDADISLDDPLVSWVHAIIGVQSDGLVFLEDLHSTNGVFINGTKLSRPQTTLGEGDRILLGTNEVSVFGVRASSAVRVEPGLQSPPRINKAATLPSPKMGGALSGAQGPGRRALGTTGRSAAIDMVGQFAEQMMESGHPLEAVRTLSEPLQNLLKGASAGLTVPSLILESATRYALRLRDWTDRDAWVDYVFELHSACQQVPSEGVLQMVESAYERGIEIDPSLVRYLAMTVERRALPVSAEEQARLLRLKALGSKLES